MLYSSILLLALPGLFAPQQDPAPDAPAVQTVGDLARHLGTFGAKPFRCSLAVQAQAPDGDFEGHGTLAWADGRHFALDFTGTAEGQDPVSLKLVADGDFLYFEGGGPAGAGVQVMKVDASLLDKLPGLLGGNALAGPGSGTNPADAWKALSGVAIASEKADDGRRFRLTLDSSVLETMGEEKMDLSLDLDGAHSFPTRLEVGDGEKTLFTLSTAELVFPKSFPEDRFTYTAPEGVMVQDMTPIFQMMLQQMEQQAGDGDADF